MVKIKRKVEMKLPKLIEWADVLGYEGLYSVSTEGQVYTHKYKKILKPRSKKGYLNVSLSKNKKRKEFKIHRLVAIDFIPNTENKEQVNHIDGDKNNNKVTNLEWVTQSENIVHSYGLGLHSTIKKPYKMTEDKIIKLKSMLEENTALKRMAETLEVSTSTINRHIKQIRENEKNG